MAVVAASARVATGCGVEEASGKKDGETLPTSYLVDIFPVENAGKRAEIPRLLGFQRP